MKQKSICMKRIIYIVTACVFVSVPTAKAQRIYSLRDCLEEGLQNNYSLRIVHNEEQISKNNATLGNAGIAYFGLFCRIYRKPGQHRDESPCHRRGHQK